MRCVVSCSSTSFPWLVFFFGALLWGSVILKPPGRWMRQGSASVVSWSREKYSCQSKLVLALSSGNGCEPCTPPPRSRLERGSHSTTRHLTSFWKLENSGDVTFYVLDINQPSLPTLFILFLCMFSYLWPFQLYFILWILQTTLCFLTLFFTSYSAFPQPWYNS